MFLRNRRLKIFSREQGARTALLALGLSLFAVISPLRAEKKINVVTTTQDLAYFARQVGGERVRVEALIRGYDDPHYIQARPDFIIKLNRADIYAVVGLDMEIGWSPALVRQARNNGIRPGSAGYCDASAGVKPLEVPSSLSRERGDIHARGNPHYWLDPLNALIMARNLRDALIRVDPRGASYYLKRFRIFAEKLKRLVLVEFKNMRAFRGLQVAVFHKEFSYLARRFRFKAAVSIEEKPGVPPSAAYMARAAAAIRREKIKIILIAPWNNPRYARSVAKRTGARVLVMPVSVGSAPGVESYEKSISIMLAKIRAAAR